MIFQGDSGHLQGAVCKEILGICKEILGVCREILGVCKEILGTRRLFGARCQSRTEAPRLQLDIQIEDARLREEQQISLMQ